MLLGGKKKKNLNAVSSSMKLPELQEEVGGNILWQCATCSQALCQLPRGDIKALSLQGLWCLRAGI